MEFIVSATRNNNILHNIASMKWKIKIKHLKKERPIYLFIFCTACVRPTKYVYGPLNGLGSSDAHLK